MRDMKAAATHDKDEVILKHLTYFCSSLFLLIKTTEGARNYTSSWVTELFLK